MATDPRQDDAVPLLRAYQAQEKAFVERRFPLQFAPEVPTIRELYSQAKGWRWNPSSDIAWERFNVEELSEDVREAARITWSRRAWGVYPGLGESTALLLRMCLESGSLGMDAKLFLSFRPAEEAKHLEVCFELADRLGGYMSDPGQTEVREISNHPFAQAALDHEMSPEAFVAALGALDDQLDLNLDVARLHASRNDVIRQALRLIIADKQRHVMFAWAFLSSRLGALDAAGGKAVVAAVHQLLEQVILRGYRNTCLLPNEAREPWLEAEEKTARHGLGAANAETERRVLAVTVAQLRERLAVWGLELPAAMHADLGEI